jgi:hypothetical protein
LNGKRVDRAEVPFGAELAIGAYRLTLLNDRPAMRVPSRSARPDPFDDMRRTEQHEAPLVGQDTPARSGAPRGSVFAMIAAIILVGLAAVVWVSGPRQAASPPDASVPADSEAATPAAASQPSVPVAPPSSDRQPEAVDLPAGSPGKRAVDTAAAGVPRAADGPRVTRRPGESTDAWRGRAAALQTRYEYSKVALDRGDYAAAAGGFEAILLEEPGFLDAPRLLVQAQAGLRASARTLFEAGTKLDAAGDWVGALQKYEQAREIYFRVPGLTESLQRVRRKLRTAGTTAFNQGRKYEADGRLQEALKEYEKALQWLPNDDPNRQVARARAEHLKKND